MTDVYDVVELAEHIARIASRTTEPEIGRELMRIVDRLLTEAGLPELPATAQSDMHHER
jgi:hypothetical protein